MTSASTRAPRLLALAALACAAGSALAQQSAAYPAKPIQLIAQQPPGSGSDAMTRVWADCAARELGQAVVVQNKPGANGILAINYLKSQPADGYDYEVPEGNDDAAEDDALAKTSKRRPPLPDLDDPAASSGCSAAPGGSSGGGIALGAVVAIGAVLAKRRRR